MRSVYILHYVCVLPVNMGTVLCVVYMCDLVSVCCFSEY